MGFPLINSAFTKHLAEGKLDVILVNETITVKFKAAGK